MNLDPLEFRNGTTGFAQAPGRPIRPILAWWGIFPVIAFIVTHAMYGWAQAQAATESGLAVSYWVGGLFGALLISFLIAWFAYGLGRMSQVTSTITFSVLLAFFCLTTYRQSLQSRALAPSLATQLAQSVPRTFPREGIALSGPPGWQELPPDRPSIITRWISPGSHSGNVSGMIMVELLKPGKDIADTARGLAQAWGGRVIDEHAILDGEDAWRIMVESVPIGMQPVEGLAIIHEGRLYVIEGGVTPGVSCHDAIESIRQSWKWTALESPAKDLRFRAQPFAALGNKISINFPAVMRTFDSKNSGQALALRLFNIRRNADDFNAYVQIGDLSNGDTFEAAQQRLGQGIPAKYNLTEEFIWQPLTGKSNSAITQAIHGPATEGAIWMMWAMIAVSDKQFVLINYTIYAQDPDDRAAYTAVAKKIADSVSLISDKAR